MLSEMMLTYQVGLYLVIERLLVPVPGLEQVSLFRSDVHRL